MVAEEPSRKMIKEFKVARWTALRTDGSHTMYGCRSGKHRFVLPDGHGTISPGVVRNARKSIAECDCLTGRKEEK
ncbi:MAG: type II toxin-antitoxin system HicA family toxin [Acidimicrobiales bacterium]